MKKFVKTILNAILSILIIVIGLGLSTILSHSKRYFTPDYDKLDISTIIYKDNITDDEYDTLFKQTGLTKIGIDRLISKDKQDTILEIQNDYFSEHETRHTYLSALTCNDEYTTPIAHTTLEKGDILISDSTHATFWHCGHSEVVINGEEELTLSSTGYGDVSLVENCFAFFYRTTFAVVRVNIDSETLDNVIDYGLNNLIGLKYQATRGFFNKKYPDELSSTQCGHLIWYMFKKFDIDLDSNGGPLAMPKDILNSEYIEIVQIFGFNPDKPWE